MVRRPPFLLLLLALPLATCSGESAQRLTSEPPATTSTTNTTTTVERTTTSAPDETTTSTSTTTTSVSDVVTHVTDGDTFDVRTAAGSSERVRIIGINAPESGECLADRAAAWLSDRIEGRDVVLVTISTPTSAPSNST